MLRDKLILGFICWCLSIPFFAAAQHGDGNDVSVKLVSYLVRKGDNITNVAKRFHVQPREIMKPNKIHSKNFIAYPGLILRIPVKVRPKVWDPSKIDDASSNYQNEDRRPSSDYEVASDYLDMYINEDFLSLIDAQDDSMQFNKIGEHLGKIDKRINYLYYKIDSFKQADFSFDYNDKDVNTVLGKMKVARDRYYSNGPIGKEIDSLTFLKDKIGQVRIKLRAKITDYEYLQDNAGYFKKYFERDQEELYKNKWGDQLGYESNYERYRMENLSLNKVILTQPDTAVKPATELQLTKLPTTQPFKKDTIPATPKAKSDTPVAKAESKPIPATQATTVSKPSTTSPTTAASSTIKPATQPTNASNQPKSPPATTQSQTNKPAAVSNQSQPITAQVKQATTTTTATATTTKPATNSTVKKDTVKAIPTITPSTIQATASTPKREKVDFAAIPKRKVVGVIKNEAPKWQLQLLARESTANDTIKVTIYESAYDSVKSASTNTVTSKKPDTVVVIVHDTIKTSVVATTASVNPSKENNTNAAAAQETKKDNITTTASQSSSQTKPATETNTGGKIASNHTTASTNNTKPQTNNAGTNSQQNAAANKPKENITQPKQSTNSATTTKATNNTAANNTTSASNHAKDNAPKAASSKANTTNVTSKSADETPKDVAPTYAKNKEVIIPTLAFNKYTYIRPDTVIWELDTKYDSSMLVRPPVVNLDPLSAYKSDSNFISSTVVLKDIPVVEYKNRPKYLVPVDSVSRIKAEFYLIRARQTLEKGDFKTGDKFLRKSLELNPNSAESWMLHADLFLTMGSADKALKEYIISSEIDSTNPKVFYNIALLFAKANDEQKAYKYFSRATDVNEKYLLAYMGRASLLMDQRDFEGAIQDYTKVLAINKYYSPAFKARGLAKMETRKFTDAIQDFNQYLEIEDPDGYVIYQRGISKILSNNLLQGCLDLSSALELGFKDAEKAIKKFCE